MATKIDDFIKRVKSTAEEDLFTPRIFYYISEPMFDEMCELLKEKKAVKPRLSIEDRCYYCGKCKETEIMTYYNYCPSCGRAVKWDD